MPITVSVIVPASFESTPDQMTRGSPVTVSVTVPVIVPVIVLASLESKPNPRGSIQNLC